ncbi:unnamed protein product [Pseudo-nitzschia multistriata]|uniref:AMMECR1 domain-containing protein n=1 Tax=Pseudo-nitzschia multistriata TaxID=183589 RepID=A0A448ZT44_9STRA|nr:unnamed protein product [Pseudo-nitzschia multistriata]
MGKNGTMNIENEEPREVVASRAMCYYSFDILIHALQRRNTSLPESNRGNELAAEFVSELPDPSIQCPLFVTWEKSAHNGSGWRLRGCIGCLNPRPLATDVGEYALISAFRDRRFNPISREEVQSLRVSVSLLVDYEDCEHVYDWTIGVHGIMIKFAVDGKLFSGTFLPEVAKQQRWDHAETISSLIRKAGYTKAIDQSLLDGIHCRRYQSSKCLVTYADYVNEKCGGIDPVFTPLGQEKESKQPWYKHFPGL